MSRLPATTARELIRALERLGFQLHRIRGSHHYHLRHPDGRSTVVPVHAGEDIGPGPFSKILRDCKLTREELAAQL
jgi:predicted RNA binding protein YcfA (HicA-like mRNA interferase family)